MAAIKFVANTVPIRPKVKPKLTAFPLKQKIIKKNFFLSRFLGNYLKCVGTKSTIAPHIFDTDNTGTNINKQSNIKIPLVCATKCIKMPHKIPKAKPPIKTCFLPKYCNKGP